MKHIARWVVDWMFSLVGKHMDEDGYKAYRSVVESSALRSIWAEVYGDRFWTDVDPPWTLATVDDVHFVTACLSPTQSCRLVDLGCGSGALARHWARDFAAQVEGFDANPYAIRLAQERTDASGLANRISLRTADIATTQSSENVFDGAASLDVLMYVPDKAKALHEVARVLSPAPPLPGPCLNCVHLALPWLCRHSSTTQCVLRCRVHH